MLKKFFHHFFVPGEHNHYHPHLLRPYMCLSLGLFSVLLFVLSVFHQYLLTNTDMLASIYPQVLAQLTNEDRAKANLKELAVSPVLEEVARLKVQDMAAKGYFAHNSPEGLTPWHWFAQAGYKYEYAGENLAIDFSDSEDVADAWMNSPTHRANILNGTYTEVGIATARGTYKGKEVVFVAQEFGTPKKAAPVSQPKFAVVEKAQASENPAVPAKSSVSKEPVRIVVNAPASTSPDGASAEESSSYETFMATGTPGVPEGEGRVHPVEKPSFWAFLVSNPQHTLGFFYFLIAGAVFIALLLLIFIEVSHHHLRAAFVTGIFLAALLIIFIVYRHYILQSLMIG